MTSHDADYDRGVTGQATALIACLRQELDWIDGASFDNPGHTAARSRIKSTLATLLTMREYLTPEQAELAEQARVIADQTPISH